jgi:ribosomal protein S18 acetylase RimI-like enzyme
LNTGWIILSNLKTSSTRILSNLLKAQKVIGGVHRGEFYISNVAVYPEFRGLGLGNELMTNAERCAGTKYLKYVSLDVEVENESAIKLYKKLGYEIIGGSKSLYLGKKFNFYRMVKKL